MSLFRRVKTVLNSAFGEHFLTRFADSLWSDAVVLALAIPFCIASGLSGVELAKVFALLIGQNVSFTWVSRARQTKSLFLHKAMSVLSNGFYIFVVTIYVAYYKNTPMKFIYVAGTIIGASIGHRGSIWIETKKAFAHAATLTRAEVEQMISSRLALLATKQEVQELRTLLEPPSSQVPVAAGKQPVWTPSEEFKHRNEILRKLTPNIPKTRARRTWTMYDRHGQLRLGL